MATATRKLLTPAWTQLRFHEKQNKLWRSAANYVAVAAGRGSGKTELARRRIIRYLPIKKDWPYPIYAYCLPTYKQARRVAWRPLLNLIPHLPCCFLRLKWPTHTGSVRPGIGLRPSALAAERKWPLRYIWR